MATTSIKVVCVPSFRFLSDELYIHDCRSPVRMQTPVLSSISGHMHSLGIIRNGTGQFRHIILRNGTGSNMCATAHATAKC